MESSEGSCSYYNVLGVDLDSSDEEIRRAYKKLAMQWHPDKWTKTPTLLSESKRKFQQIQEAYSVLSNRTKRAMYDVGLYNPHDDEDEVEGFADFVQEMVSLMEDVKKEGKSYSMEDLQSMYWEMAQGFDSPDWCSIPQNPSPDWCNFSQNPVCETPQWFCGPMMNFDDSGTPGSSASSDSTNSRLCVSGFEMYGASHLCR